MQKEIFNIYGYCEIPKGTLLYRGHRSDEIYDEMFFGTKLNPIKCFGEGKVQVWKVKRKITVLFLVKHVNLHSHGISSIPDIYYDIYPNEVNKSLTDLCIKQDIRRRRPFARHLFESYNINGWFSSIENRTENEVCLFNIENINKLVERTNIIDIEGKEELDSLRKIKLFPPDSFYSSTYEIMSKYNSPYKNYRIKVRYCVKDYIEQGVSASDAK